MNGEATARDSNPCGQSPMDFESISLAARTHCLGMACNSNNSNNFTPVLRGNRAAKGLRRVPYPDSSSRQRGYGTKTRRALQGLAPAPCSCPLPRSMGSSNEATARGFEPLRAEPNGFPVHHLNHSFTLSGAESLACLHVCSCGLWLGKGLLHMFVTGYL